MKRIGLVAAIMMSVLVAAKPAEAGRRARRTTAIVAAATAPVAVAAAAAPRRTTVVAAAAVTPVDRPTAGTAPDLTITKIVVEQGALCITVKNIGHASSPTSRLQIDLSCLGVGFVAGQTARVLPLAVNQSVKIRLRSAPVSGMNVFVRVDPLQEVAELNERNNDRAATFAAQATSSEPRVLEDDAAWGGSDS